MAPENATAGSGGSVTYDGDPRHLTRWRERDAPPSIAVWEITLQCDLGCRHCGSRAGRARPDELSTAEALDIVAQMAEVGIRELTLIGGEAYLRADWPEIARAASDSGIAVSMVTGGRAFTAERAAAAAEAGVAKVGVSLDGLARTHDAQRGLPGSWEAAMASIAAIRDAGIEVSVNTQINRLTMPELPAVADLLVAQRIGSWMVQLTVPMGRAADRPGLLLQPYHLLDLFPLLEWIKRESLDPNGIGFFPGNNIGYFGPYETRLRYGGAAGHVWSGCGAGRSSIGIEADGALKGCPSLPSAPYTGGNLRDRRLADMLREKGLVLDPAGDRGRDQLWGFCRDCVHADRCRAGCTWTSHCLLGRPGNNPYCHHRALELDRQGLRERVELTERASGKPFDFGRYHLIEEPADAPLPDGADSPVPLAAMACLTGLPRATDGLWPAADVARLTRRYAVAR